MNEVFRLLIGYACASVALLVITLSFEALQIRQSRRAYLSLRRSAEAWRRGDVPNADQIGKVLNATFPLNPYSQEEQDYLSKLLFDLKAAKTEHPQTFRQFGLEDSDAAESR